MELIRTLRNTLVRENTYKPSEMGWLRRSSIEGMQVSLSPDTDLIRDRRLTLPKLTTIRVSRIHALDQKICYLLLEGWP